MSLGVVAVKLRLELSVNFGLALRDFLFLSHLPNH